MATPTAERTNAPSPSLPKLLASLALGARSVNNLPLARSPNSDDEADDDDADEDEYSFRMSLPEFASLNNEARHLLSSLLNQSLDNDDDSDGMEVETDFEDPQLWQDCADACDALLGRVTSYIAAVEKRRNGVDEYETLGAWADAIGNASDRARGKASGSYGKMLQGLASMEKPQMVYSGFVTHPPQNSRGELFLPIIFDARKQAMLDEGKFNRDGHGLDSRFGETVSNGDDGDATKRKFAKDMIAPSYHISHPFHDEIEWLEYRPWQLDVSNIDTSKEITAIQDETKDDPGIWIGNEDELTELATRINDGEQSGEIREIALDLEAHSHRTFAGFVCLIQLSIRRPKSDDKAGGGPGKDISSGYDFLIDALSLRHVIPTCLGPILANPNILKVMHGADSDIPWLQRDFGCYVVNLFDTGRASRALKFQSAGLAFLLRKYAGLDPDKAHQLSDWRRRPLPDDMRTYAVADTRYLLDIYDKLRLELKSHHLSDVSIEAVLDRSKQVCLIRYEKEPFRPSGFQNIMDGGKSRRAKKGNKHEVTSELSPQQEAALRHLYDWRDTTARQEDESVQYVCPNSALLRIASNRPVTVSALQRLVNPLPPLVMRRSQEILDVIKATTVSVSKSSLATASSLAAAVSKKEEDTKESAVAAPVAPPSPTANRREMLSPILGCEALYSQAGWMAPDGNELEDEAIHRGLDVNSANQNYSSSRYQPHSIEMSPTRLTSEMNAGRTRSTCGLGTARAVLGGSSGKNAAEEDFEVAQRSANLIQKEMAKALADGGHLGRYGKGFSLIDYIKPMMEGEDYGFEDRDLNPEDNSPAKQDQPEEDEMTIPKSMREIYDLSNANRRKEKSSPKQSEKKEGTASIQRFEEDSLEGAEAVIGGYFGSNKKQKMGSLAPGKEGDVELMTELGWVKGKADAESLTVTSHAALEHEGVS
eukprot:g4578.t1 g4578   contig15:1326820-1329624(+)